MTKDDIRLTVAEQLQNAAEWLELATPGLAELGRRRTAVKYQHRVAELRALAERLKL